jgi:enamine deaminase RidA (YjgF/YER057c/UK114 family)
MREEESMTSEAEMRLQKRGLGVPTPAKSLANYVPAMKAGSLVFIAGQLPMKDGKIAFEGTLGKNVDIETGKKAAELCALNILGQLKAKVGTLDNVRCVRLGGFVQSTPDFKEHSSVINGASDLLVYALGENGVHARAAVGCISLPLGAPVEVEAVFETIGSD